MTTTHPVFATDVGFGNTKSAFRLGDQLKFQIFRSLATLVGPNKGLASLNMEGGSQRKIVRVTIEGVDYEVGPGVNTTNSSSARTLADDFPATPNYAALLAGAFHFANVSSVERLVLGLPIHTLSRYHALLETKFKGKLDFGTFTVDVGTVSVLPQPLGTLLSATKKKLINTARGAAILLIDVGYFSVDWVVMSDGQIDKDRSNGDPSGASKVYRRIAEALSSELRKQVTGIERIDASLRENLPFTAHGKEFNLRRDYLPQAISVCRGAVKVIQSSVGNTEDIREIWLSGGAANLYVPAVSEAFDGIPMNTVENPCYANVEGFLLSGESARRRATA